VVLINKNKSKKIDLRDVGAAVENILLSLVCFRLGGCWIGAIDKRRLRKILNIPSCYKIDSLVAIGFPVESPILEEKDDIKYWLDEKNRLHVPKRPLKSILHHNKIIPK
jgi:nitroreductase